MVDYLPGDDKMHPYLSRKYKIVVSALEIIDELGIDGLSLRELAKRQGITEGALYKHFNSKEEILASVLDYYSRYDEKIKNTIGNSTMTPKEAIVFFIGSFAEIYESHPAMTCIVNSYEVLSNESMIVKRVKEIFTTRSEYVTSLVERGQKDGSIYGDFPPADLSTVIAGLLRTTALKWRISKYGFPLKSKVTSTLELLLSRF